MSVVSLVLLVFCDLLALDFHSLLCLVHDHDTLFVVPYCCWFSMVFFLFSSRSFLYCFDSLELVGKYEKLMELGEICMVSNG